MEQYLTTPVLVVFGIAAILLIIGAFLLISKLVISKSITQLKFKDFEIDFTDYKKIKENGEGNNAEKFRALVLKQLLFTQEFVNRFQPLVASFVNISKKWDESLCSDENDKELKYPTLKFSGDALKRFRDLLRNTKFDYVINWDCPIYDKVNSGYRENYIANLGHLENHIVNSNIYIPNLINDCSSNSPTIDIKETSILSDYSNTKIALEEYVTIMDKLLRTPKSVSEQDANDTEYLTNLYSADILLGLKTCIKNYEKYISLQNDKENILISRYNYAMDICNTLYESLLFWNEKTPRILQSETAAILYIIYQHLSLWLIRNDLPLSQVKLEQYLDAHAKNLVAKINEEVIKEFPRFNSIMWEQALDSIHETDDDVNHYFRNAIRDWIIGVQQVRFGINIFIGNEDFKA